MKCQDCNTELAEGTKFCTTCGTRTVAPVKALACQKCSAELKEGSKFCTSCGTPAQSTATPEAPAGASMNEVKQKIFWNIQKGEIACRINESEFIRYDSAQGLIVNDGTTAYIKANGKVLAEIHGGVYDFIDPKELEQILESRRGGVVGMATGTGRFLVNALLGRRVKDKFSGKDDPARQRSLDAVIESMKRNEAFSLQLKLDKSFSLVFGQGTAEEAAEFKPMTVRTKLMDMQVGLRAIFRIGDFDRFAEHFLTDEAVATTRNIADALHPTIQSAVQAVMQNFEVGSAMIPTEVVEAINAKILMSNDQFHGLTLERVAEVVSSNEDLERLRGLSRELYLSEQELDFLRRTNDFRNRLSTETNEQAISEARSDLALYRGLQEVNKDNLLAEDELDKFYTILSREKIIRDAKNQDEIDAALTDIAKTGLVREEDIDNLRMDIATRQYQRGEVIKLMQLKDEIEFEKVRTAGEGQIAIEAMKQGLELQDLQLSARRREDDYGDERRSKDREHYRADRLAEIDADNAEMDAQLERLRKVEEINREGKKQDQAHELDKERIHLDKLDRQAQLSAEQLMAIAANENLDKEAAARFAESFSAGKNAEQIQQAADARIADAHRNQDTMMEMMREMRKMATDMTGHIVQNKDDQKNEYRERLERQETRMDHTQDSALEYATRNNQQAAQKGRACPSCGVVAAADIRFCANCGKDMTA